MHDIHALLSLMSIPGIGPHRIRRLVGRFGSAGAALKAGKSALLQVEGIDEKTAYAIRHKAEPSFAELQLKKAQSHGVRLVSYWNEEYPESLKRTYDPPVLLFVKGSLLPSPQYALAIVGTRLPTPYGRWVAERFGRDLAHQGITVISGLARGIDTLAHKGALDGGGRTIESG